MLNSNSIALMKHVYAAKKAAGIALQPNHVLQTFAPEAIAAATMAVAICRDLGETEFSANLVNNGIVDAAASVVVPLTDDADISAVLEARAAIVAAWPLMVAFNKAKSQARRNAHKTGDDTEYMQLLFQGCPEMDAAQEQYRAAVKAANINPYAEHAYDGSNQQI